MSVAVLVSQPFAALPSQSVKPGEHEYMHAPAAHEATVLGRGAHARPQPPQWATVLVVLTSQPLAAFMSQLAKPVLHVPTPQVPIAHAAVPLAGVAQALPQAPQWASVLARVVSQPLAALLSQLPRPAAHIVTAHVPLLHAFVPPGSVQRVPHALQLFTSVRVLTSQPFIVEPSQLA